MFLLVTYLLIALGISFLCSILEAVLLSTTISYVSMKESEGHKWAPLLRSQKDNIDRPISAILSLNTIAHTIGAAGVGSQAVVIYGQEYFGIISAVLTVLILVFSEIIPKTIGARYWRNLAIPSAPVIKYLIIITYPLVWLSELITRMISSGSESVAVSREEVSAMVSEGHQAGVFHGKENKMIQHLIKMSNVTAREVMTPSVVVSMADESMTLQEFCKDKSYNKHSRIPIYKESKEYIVGYVLRGEALEKLSDNCFDLPLKKMCRPILSFVEAASLMDIWEKMIESKEHISIIIDEYGCMRGVVTMEDIIETMLGFEIVDEKDSVEDMQALARQRWSKMQSDNDIES